MAATVHYIDVVAALHQPSSCSPSPPPAFSAGRLPCPDQISCCTHCDDSPTNSTPFVSAPSSPREISSPCGNYYFTTPLSPPSPALDIRLHYDAVSAHTEPGSPSPSSLSLSEFEFSSKFSESDASFYPNTMSAPPPMSTAEELFHNGRIRPLNTRSCSSSYCTCFSDAMLHDDYHDPHFQDACPPYTDGPSSARAEPHCQQQQHQFTRKQIRLGHTDPTSATSALEQWKQSMGKGHPRHEHGVHHAERVIQITSMPLACYRNSGHEGTGHHRRAGSLSPLRVFHIDEKVTQGRASFDSERGTDTYISHGVDEGTNNIRSRRSRRSWTLKELLNMGDNRVHDKRPKLRQIGAESAKSRRSAPNRGRMEESGVSRMRSLEEEKWHSKSSTHNEVTRSPWDLQQAVEEHGDHQYYVSSSVGGYNEEGQVEEMRKRNFLPYKKGLMSCLGFNSKLNSIKGLQSCIGP